MTRAVAQSPPHQLLQRCVAELRLCNQILARVEDGVLPFISSPMAAELGVGLQDIDLLRQSIEDIAQFIDGLSHAMAGPDWVDPEEILRTIKLQSMRVRLGGGDTPVRSSENFVEF